MAIATIALITYGNLSTSVYFLKRVATIGLCGNLEYEKMFQILLYMLTNTHLPHV